MFVDVAFQKGTRAKAGIGNFRRPLTKLRHGLANVETGPCEAKAGDGFDPIIPTMEYQNVAKRRSVRN